MKQIAFTVTSDLSYDQRMQRICSSLHTADYQVTLIGRRLKGSVPLRKEPYRQTRLNCFFASGKAMYAEFNLRLFLYLLFHSADCLCAIDLDTILPVYFASILKKTKRVYDAHELFTEQKEIVTRPLIHKLWLKVERYAVPKFVFGYTVNDFIAAELHRRYGVKYYVTRNLPKFFASEAAPDRLNPFLIYQGSVNEGRSFETLIPAMKQVNARLVICGNGNFFDKAKSLIKKHKVANKIELWGLVSPEELRKLTPKASVAIMLFENTGLNQFQSLANRFFDYIMAGVPQVCVGYPQYEAINDKYQVAYLIYNTDATTIATAVNNLLADDVLYNTLQQNCLKAREELNWNSEEKVLLQFYEKVFSS